MIAVKSDNAIPLHAVGGNRDIQAELGIGLKLMEWKALVGVCVQAPNTNGGVNYIFNDCMQPYFSFHTLKSPTATQHNAPFSDPL
jgi:hypothetical protein